ncbi:hypothetical protein QYM36_005455 [Artemia franciscana]|uniref:Uncharacterized protein n=1 Tax=Artemia franciscana TaxID=6661 RepID=A0AA88I148_ARTSF|nr:hypothetical protein QYM36_005455 [Artemia franciscana]
MVSSTGVSVDSTGCTLFLFFFGPEERGVVGATEGEFEGLKISSFGEYSGVVTGVWKGGLERIGCERLWLNNFEDLPEACLFCIVDVEHKGFGGDSGCTKVNGATGYCMVGEELCT